MSAYTRLVLLTGACLLVLVSAGCDFKRDSIGDIERLIVFADSSDWLEYKDAMESVFSKVAYNPTEEREFLLEWHSLDELDIYQNRKNVVFMSRLDSRLPVSAFVNGAMGEDVKAKIQTGDAFYIPQFDNWALDQYVLFLVAPTRAEMIQRIYDLGELAYDDFRKYYFKRLEDRLYHFYENKELSDYLATHFPFTLRIQADYKSVDESVEDGFVWLRRYQGELDRSILIHWLPYADSIEISKEWIIAERNRLAAKVLSGDLVVEQETTEQRIKFNRWEGAYRIEGNWMNPEAWVGGPFRNITFHDKKNNLIYMIDFHVMAIAQRKKLYLDQLDIMAHTFEAKGYGELRQN